MLSCVSDQMEEELATDFKDVYIWNINIQFVILVGSMNIYALLEYNIHRGTLGECDKNFNQAHA